VSDSPFAGNGVVVKGQERRLPSSPWPAFLLRRLFSMLIILVALATATFMLIRWIPGDPAVVIAGDSATSAHVASIRTELGLDQPLLVQYAKFWIGLAHGELGNSFVVSEPVGQIIWDRAGASVQLAAAALVLVMLVSIPAGLLAGTFTRDGRHRHSEVLLTGVASIVGAVPEFLTATFLVLVFAVSLRLLPVAGQANWQSLILPTLALSLRPIAILTRLVRVETLNVLNQDYIRTAESKRLPARLLILRHVLPNVVSGALTIGGLLFAGLVGGAVVVETVFARNGLGSALVSAVLAHDYPVIQGLLLVLGATVVVVNGIVDVLLAVLDPRSMARHA
jgi:peptide/nickel transport system permease protein